MESKEETQKKIAKLQMMEQRLQNYIMQKQSYQSQLLEVENALGESENSEEIYKIFGQIMVKVKKEELLKELKEKKELLNKKIEEIEKQETKLGEEITPLQEEVMKSFKDGK